MPPSTPAGVATSTPNRVFPASAAWMAVPLLVLAITLVVWVVAVSKSGFFADDYFNLVRYGPSFGDLANTTINQGRYTINAFWHLGQLAFGDGSVIPFLVSDALVFACGLLAWLSAWSGNQWSRTEAWLVAGLLLAPGIALPIVLWSSNIVHAAAFFGVGLASLANKRSLATCNATASVLWLLAGALGWLLAVVSDPLYIGSICIAGFCAYSQFKHLRHLGVEARSCLLLVAGANVVVPVAYFLFVALPSTTSAAPYSHVGLRFLRTNLSFYHSHLAASNWVAAAYVFIILAAIVFPVIAALRGGFFPVSVTAAGWLSASIALLQGQQRSIHYMCFALLCLVSAAVAGAESLRVALSPKMVHRAAAGWYAILLIISLVLLRSGLPVRSYFLTEPYGSDLINVRAEVASLVPTGTDVCIDLDLSPAERARFTAEIAQIYGFEVPPVSAGSVLLSPGLSCRPRPGSFAVVIKLAPGGEFVATAPAAATGPKRLTSR